MKQCEYGSNAYYPLKNGDDSLLNMIMNAFPSLAAAYSLKEEFGKRTLLGLSKAIRYTLRAQLHSVSVPDPRGGAYNRYPD